MNIDEKQIRDIDLPDLPEIFADSLNNFSFDGQVARLEFSVLRPDSPNQERLMTARRYPTCRLILPAKTFFEMADKLQRLMQSLQEQGALKRVEPEKGTSH